MHACSAEILKVQIGINIMDKQKVVDLKIQLQNQMKPQQRISDCGSAPFNLPLNFYYCANNTGTRDKFCAKEAKSRCSACFLVAYCSKECQREHWEKHRKDCKSTFGKADWQPDWICENRSPDFTSKEFVGKCYLWGKTPAFDIMNWPNNELENVAEGTTYNKETNIMFAASGDIRNLVETLASLPSNVKGPIRIILNDRSQLVTARNFLMLLLLKSAGRRMIDDILEFWYSSLFTGQQFHYIDHILDEFGNVPYRVTQDKAMFGKDLFTLVLHNPLDIFTYLSNMFQLLSSGKSDSSTRVMDSRKRVKENTRTLDSRQSYMKTLKPQQRLAWIQFANSGVFLPFAAVSSHFVTGNKFILNPETKSWIIPDDSDPTDGWNMEKVMEFAKKMNLPVNDLFGCLFYYVRDRLLKVVKVLETVPIEVEIYCQEASSLVQCMKGRKMKFDRIDVSNLSDKMKIGIDKVLKDWGPLLNKKNKFATLISLFTKWHSNAKPEEKDFEEIRQKFGNESEARVREMLLYNNSAMASGLLDDSDDFQKYLLIKTSGENFGVVERKEHKIVPHRLFAPIDAPETYILTDDQLYYGSCVAKCSLRERYVEWCNK